MTRLVLPYMNFCALKRCDLERSHATLYMTNLTIPSAEKLSRMLNDLDQHI
ncbi:MAG: hypothetical protein ACJASB_001107 [Shewanella psychromarinicola]|jgi:hypothetical protein